MLVKQWKLGATLWGNLSTGKAVKAMRRGWGVIAEEGAVATSWGRGSTRTKQNF